MYENLKVEFDEKILALAEYLELEEDEVEEIEESYGNYIYNNKKYYVLDEFEANDMLEGYIDDMIDQIQTALDRGRYDYSYYLKVDEDAIRENYDYNSISENWKEVGDYYIFEI